LIVRADSELPAVWCDEMRVLQVFQNLISNASKYSPPHTPITISVDYDQNRADLRFTVSDQGRGIAPSELPFLFERAYRSLNASDQIKGTGLGLYLARLLIELHGGRIWCHSVVGQGSNFHFTLPVAAERHDS
jgi:signal transduction histidine kinase